MYGDVTVVEAIADHKVDGWAHAEVVLLKLWLEDGGGWLAAMISDRLHSRSVYQM